MAAFYFGKDHILKYTNKEVVVDPNQARIDSLNAESKDSLVIAMNDLIEKLSEYEEKINEQENVINKQKKEQEKVNNKYTKEIKKLTAINKALRQISKEEIDKKQEKTIQDLARTLGSMKVDELRPILKNLPDDMIKLLYNKTKSRDRAKIFNSLPAGRAGRIIRKMTENFKKG